MLSVFALSSILHHHRADTIARTRTHHLPTIKTVINPGRLSKIKHLQAKHRHLILNIFTNALIAFLSLNSCSVFQTLSLHAPLVLLGLFDELSLSLPVREHVWLGRSLEASDVDIPLLAPLALFGLVDELALSLPVLEHVWLGSSLESRDVTIPLLAPVELLRLRD